MTKHHDLSLLTLCLCLLGLSPLTAADSSPWDSHMHGVEDVHTTAVPFSKMEEQENLAPYLSRTPANLPGKKTPSAVLNLPGGTSLNLSHPLLDNRQLYDLRGQNIRVFYWLRGQDTGKNGTLFDAAPRIVLTVQKQNGDVLLRQESPAKTRGTFPWFCYYVELTIPSNAGSRIQRREIEETPEQSDSEDDAILTQLNTFLPDVNVTYNPFPLENGLFLTLSNPTSGTASFAAISWCKITEEEKLNKKNIKNDRMHPLYHTLAPNPEYDELPMHFYFGQNPDRAWTWIKGTKTLPDLTRTANAVKLLKEHAKDWSYMLYAVPEMLPLHSLGHLSGAQKDFEKGWDIAVAGQILDMQDSRTGLWRAPRLPELFATERIVSSTFTPADVRTAECTIASPWYAAKGVTLSNADALIQTILSARRKDSRGIPAGWSNQTSFDSGKQPSAEISPCDILATRSAVRLLNAAIPYASTALRVEARKNIRSAWSYVLKYMFTDSRFWKAHATDSRPTSPVGFFALADAARWLDFRVDETRQPVTYEHSLKLQENTLILSWLNANDAELVALRVFLAPVDLPNNQLTPAHLLAILQPTPPYATNAEGKRVYVPIMPSKKDPLFAARDIAAAVRQQMNYTPLQDNARFYDKRLQELLLKNPLSNQDNENFILQLPRTGQEQSIRLAGVTLTGEMTPFVVLPQTIPAYIPPAPAPAETQNAPAAENEQNNPAQP